MTDVLESTAGYIDSELSDYEDNYKDYNNTNSLNNYYLTNYNNYSNNNNVYHLKNNNNINYNKFNHNNSNNETLNSNNLYKWSKCVNKYELKSPRFGRDDLNNNLNKLNSDHNVKEYLCNRTSLETVDTLTPLSNSFEKSFKWWKDDESHSNNSELLNDTTEEEFDNKEDYYGDVDNSDNDLTTKNNNELLTETNTKLTNNNEDNIEWKSWTVGTNELNELKAKLLNKLLNKNSNNKLNEDLMNNFEVSDQQVDKSNELKYYKDMNNLLLNKLLWLLNNKNYKLEYNLNQQYITSIQNHLVKVHEYINNLTTTYNVNSESDETTYNSTNKNVSEVTDKSEDQNEFDTSKYKDSDFNFEDYEKLKMENLELKNQVEQLHQELTNLKTNGFKSDTNLVDNEYNTTEDTEKKELREKLKLVEESKNMLEEDFKKTLVYMRLMKDRLKIFKDFNTQKFNTSAATTTNTNTSNTSSVSNTPNQNNLSTNFVNRSVTQVANQHLNNHVNVQTNHVNNNTKFVNRQFKPTQYTSPFNKSPLHKNTGGAAFVLPTVPGGLSPMVSSLKPSNVNTNNTVNTNNNNLNTSKFSPVNNFKKRSNSCVRFKEESELYVVPRSLSETRPTTTNNKFSKFFKLFSKS